MFELLEPRLLCHVAVLHRQVHWYVQDGTLHISGSVHDDTIAVVRSKDRLRLALNGKASVVHGRVRRAVIYGGRGDDSIQFGSDSPQALGFYAVIDGGTGNDGLYSGNNTVDTLFGGEGNDTLFAITENENLQYPSTDYLDGGPGDDQMFDGGTMYGGTGRDFASVELSVGVDLPLTSGVEMLQTADEEFGDTGGVVPPDYYQSDLFVRDDKLVFEYQVALSLHTTLSGPTLNPLGQYEIRKNTPAGIPPAPELGTKTQTFVFDLAKAQRRGVVLSIDPVSAFYQGQFTIFASNR